MFRSKCWWDIGRWWCVPTHHCDSDYSLAFEQNQIYTHTQWKKPHLPINFSYNGCNNGFMLSNRCKRAATMHFSIECERVLSLWLLENCHFFFVRFLSINRLLQPQTKTSTNPTIRNSIRMYICTYCAIR